MKRYKNVKTGKIIMILPHWINNNWYYLPINDNWIELI